jgi:hypothetical protein
MDVFVRLRSIYTIAFQWHPADRDLSEMVSQLHASFYPASFEIVSFQRSVECL